MRYFITFACLFLARVLFSQEQLGLRLENYAGVSSLSLNPAGNLSNPLNWDINIVGAGVFFENNYAFIQNTNTLELLRRRNDAEFVFAGDVEGKAPDNAFIFDYFTGNKKRFVASSNYVDGPSFAFKIGENHSAGVFTRVRTAVGSQNIPGDFSYYVYDPRALFESFSVEPFELALMSWTEIGLNYAFKIPDNTGFFGFGANIRFLQGYEAAYVENIGTYQHEKLEGNTISLTSANGRFGYTDSNLDGNSFDRQKNGSGLAFDLGFTKEFQNSDESYKLRLGASLLDIGALRFDKNAQAHRVDIDSTSLLSLDDYNGYNSLEELDDIVKVFSLQALADSLATEEGSSFKMAMPAALSLQADYAVTPNFFVNALLVQRIPTASPTARRGNVFALTPRLEHRWFSASLPISLYNYQVFRVGFAARLGYLVVGSDDIGSLFGRSNYTGTDFYIALKFNPFKTDISLFGGGGGKRRHGGKGKVKCYDF